MKFIIGFHYNFKMKKRTKIILIIFLIFSVIIVGFIIWAEMPSSPMPDALLALNSNYNVSILIENDIIFMPTGSAELGFIIYPGGRIDYRSYAPLALSIAEKGYMVAIVRMPLNLAIFDSNAALRIIEKYPEIELWCIGGHSLGGTMAAQFASSNLDIIKGLILWASYPASDNDLSKKDIPVATIYGSNDGLISIQQIQESLKLLPQNTIKVEIFGGNHAQFGWYGPQEGDNVATITRENQQNQIIEATIELFNYVLK
ncbi:alpha/beta hydrolase [Candidatus Bathyarchaeota archaeon]|nr:alpha/beta hydrolase [Candidatus Bathyarchaeota archaeon]